MNRFTLIFVICFVLFSCISNNQVQETSTTTVFRQNPDDELFNKMKQYVEDGNSSSLSSLFENNAPVKVKKVINRVVAGGRNLLHKAVLDEYEDIVALLLDNGADKTVKDNQGKSAADYAMKARSAKIRELFGIKEEIVSKETKRVEDIKTKEESKVAFERKELAAKEVNIQEDVNGSKTKGVYDFNIHYNVTLGETNSPLLLAVKKQDYSGAKKAIMSTHDIDVTDKLGNNALFYAISSQNMNILNLLLGEEINCNQINHVGQLPLLYAVEKENSAIIAALLQNGASINQQDNNGITAAMIAVIHRNTSLVRFLWSNGANLLAWDGDGNTLLHMAMRNEDMPMVSFLIEKGCDVYASNDAGVTPLDMMKKSKRRDFQRMAEEYED